MKNIFISYSSSDIEFIEKLIEILPAKIRELIVWDKTRLQAGKYVKTFIKDEVDKSAMTILIVSEKSLRSTWVSYEVQYTLDTNKIFFPIYYGPGISGELLCEKICNDTKQEIDRLWTIREERGRIIPAPDLDAQIDLLKEHLVNIPKIFAELGSRGRGGSFNSIHDLDNSGKISDLIKKIDDSLIPDTHPCDEYVKHFYIERESKDFVDDTHSYLKKYTTALQNYLEPTMLVDRLRGLDRDSSKLINLFEHQIDDIVLTDSRGEQAIYTDYIGDLITRSRKVPYLIVGEAGGGKTSLCYMLFQQIIRTRYVDIPKGKKIIPIYLPVYMLKTKNDIENMLFFKEIYTDLKNSSGAASVHEMIMQGRVIILIDGLDEIDADLLKHLNTENQNDEDDINLSNAHIKELIRELAETYKGCSLVFTCRKLFHDNYAEAIRDFGFSNSTLYIKPLNEKQIAQYTHSRLNDGTLARQTIDLIKRTNLFELAPTVVMLEMIVSIMQDEKERNSFLIANIITRADIYKKLTWVWSKHQSVRVATRHLLKIPSYQNDLEKATNITERLLMIVSLAMFYHGQDGMLVISEDKLSSYIRRYDLDEQEIKDYNNDIKSILTKGAKNVNYCFNHKTVVEYLIAEAILLGLEGDLRILTNNIENAIFIMLCRPLDKQDDEIFNFLRELVPDASRNKNRIGKLSKRLLQVVTESTSLEKQLVFSAEELHAIRNNAVKILAFINGHNLSAENDRLQRLDNDGGYKSEMFQNLFVGKNFSGIKLDNCIMTKKNLAGSDFSNAVLQGVNLSGCNLYDTNLYGADLTGSYLGDCHSIWSMAYDNHLLTFDGGNGEPVTYLLPIKTIRTKKESSIDSIIWNIEKIVVGLNTYTISVRNRKTLLVYNIKTGEKKEVAIDHPLKAFAILYSDKNDVLFYAGDTGHIYFISHFSELLEQKNVETYLKSDIAKKYHHLYPDLSQAYLKRDHLGTIFGLAFSNCHEYLVSCSVDGSYKLWRTDEILDGRHINDHVIPKDVKPDDERSHKWRKLIHVYHNNIDYFICGSNFGKLQLFRIADESLVSQGSAEGSQRNWILDIRTFAYNGEVYVVTVSGDFKACIWKFRDLIHIISRPPVYVATYTSSLLSIAIENDSNGNAIRIYIGTYDGNVIQKEIDIILGHQFGKNKGRKTTSEEWTRTDTIIEIDALPEAFISDATNADIRDIIGLNEGRLQALRERGAISYNADTTHAGIIKKELNKINKSVRTFLVNSIASDEKYDNSLELYIAECNSYIEEFNKLAGKIRDFTNSHCENRKLQIIDLYQQLTATKVTIASALMILYWLDHSTWRENRKVPIDQYSGDTFSDILDIQEITTDIVLQRERVIFEDFVERVRKSLEEHFATNNADRIFEITFEDYQSNIGLRRLCDFLAGVDTDEQIPDESIELKEAGIDYLWTEISNNFWTGNSRIARTYFESFVGKIYKCCGETHKFLIDEIVSQIRSKNKLGEPIIYLDLATGFNGTIIVGVYNSLSETERNNVKFFASDSSPKIVNTLKDKLKGTKIEVMVQNLVEVNDFDPNSCDIISQNLGAHHLSKKHQDKMYRRFISLLKSNGILAVGDVSQQPIKILAGLPDDIGAPEYPYDCRKLGYSELISKNGGCFPKLENDEGFYTCQIYEVVK